MELRALRFFVEVVRQGGFSQAAKHLFSTQSTMSKAVQQLENEMGLRLLERTTGRSPTLTDAGKIVYSRATALLVGRDDMMTELNELRGLKRGTLRLGLPIIGSSLLFAKLFATYRRVYPGVEIILCEHGSKKLEEMLLANEIDLAASLLPADDAFDYQSVRKDPIDLLVPEDHPLAARESVTWKELQDLPFILFGPEVALNPLVLQACEQNGFTPTLAASSHQIDFVIELVAAHAGISFLPRLIWDQRIQKGIRNIPVIAPSLEWNIAIIWRRGGYISHAAQAWLDLAKKS